MNWTGMFSPTVPVLELFLRGTVTFLLLYALIRIVGRRESGQVGMTDVLLIVLVADAASSGMNGGGSSITDGFIVTVTILFWSLAIDALSYRFPWVSRLAKAKPAPLITEGSFVRKTMRHEVMTTEEVMTLLRVHGIDDPVEVEHAYLEPNGTVSVVTKEEAERARREREKNGEPGERED